MSRAWLKSYRLVVVGQGAVVVVLGAPHAGAAAVASGGFGIEPDHLREVGDGAVVVLLAGPSGAAVGVGEHELGIAPDRLVVVGDGPIDVLLDVVRVPAVVE